MKIKKFEGPTEQAALQKVKNEFGLDALIFNKKKKWGNGIFFWKTKVEITAAYEETSQPDYDIRYDTVLFSDIENASHSELSSATADREVSLDSTDREVSLDSTDREVSLDSTDREVSPGETEREVFPSYAEREPYSIPVDRELYILPESIKTDSAPVNIEPSLDVSNIENEIASEAANIEYEFTSEAANIENVITSKTANVVAKSEPILETSSFADSAPIKTKTKTIAEYIEELNGEQTIAAEFLKRAEKQFAESDYERSSNKKYNHEISRILYDVLTHNGVLGTVADGILTDVDGLCENEESDVNLIVEIVYNAIVDTIGKPHNLITEASRRGSKELPGIYVFMGPTGVGKTTTIAKISADLLLNKRLSIGLITADTYRIAAVEQLKTYAGILGLEVGVAYSKDDMKDHIEEQDANDVILIDTAGRSHKNVQNISELFDILSGVGNCERYLVLSMATKYEDLIKIVDIYKSYADFSFIFTKLDETDSLGAILNLCKKTGVKVSYITFGHNVPEDMQILQPEEIAKALLGLGDGYGVGLPEDLY